MSRSDRNFAQKHFALSTQEKGTAARKSLDDLAHNHLGSRKSVNSCRVVSGAAKKKKRCQCQERQSEQRHTSRKIMRRCNPAENCRRKRSRGNAESIRSTNSGAAYLRREQLGRISQPGAEAA